jgi:hypothetical protein
MKLYVVSNGAKKYIGPSGEWKTVAAGISVYTSQHEAKASAHIHCGHVVELVEKPEPVEVSEEESEMLKKASNLRDWRPAAVISEYAYEHDRHSCDDEVILEDRLMRAYVNGWTVEKPKRWIVKVPHTDDSYFYKIDDEYCNAGDSYHLEGMTDKKWFTLAEIEHYGLGGYEKVEVKDD